MRIKRYIRRLYKFFNSSYSKIWALAIILVIFWNTKKDQIADIVRQNRHWYIPDSDFFKPIVFLKPTQNKKTGIKFFKGKREALSEFRLVGFKYCQWLDNSWFYGNVYIDKLNGTVMAVNPIRQTIMDLIDHTAKNITDFIYDRSPSAVENVFQVINMNRMLKDWLAI